MELTARDTNPLCNDGKPVSIGARVEREAVMVNLKSKKMKGDVIENMNKMTTEELVFGLRLMIKKMWTRWTDKQTHAVQRK